jgi:hypothetical protein
MNGTNLYATDVNAPKGFRPASLEEIMVGARRRLVIEFGRARNSAAHREPVTT